MGSIVSDGCLLHAVAHKVYESIAPFTAQTLVICEAKHNIHSQRPRSKYKRIILPTHVDGVSGYHPSCYRYFTAVQNPKANTERGRYFK